MRISKLLSVAGISVALSATATAQFSESGPGSAIPAVGTGGDGGATYDTVMPATPAVSSVSVAAAVTSIDSIEIDGLSHTWIGDTMATLADPNGVEHLIWLRPGYLNTGSFGNSGDFDGGNYTFVGDGSGAPLPTTSDSSGAPAGTYEQTFSSGGVTWTSGTNGINNTPMGSIAGPAGTWTLTIYDWGGGDTGAFTGWTLNGQNAPVGPNTGAPYCFGDGTGAACPCGAVGSAGAGCPNSAGGGATIVGSGDADTANDSFGLTVSGAPAGNFAVFFQGTTQVALPFGEGILCINPIARYAPAPTDASGGASLAGGGAGGTIGGNAGPGVTMNYSFWYRDTANTCAGAGFNFTNGWSVTWN